MNTFARSRIALAIPLLVSCIAYGQAWVRLGPGPNTGGQVEGITGSEVVGAVHAIAVHPTSADTIYAGSVNGGIWKTANATATSPTWVEQLGLGRSLSIGALEFDPTDATNQTLIAGSGRFSSYSRFGGARVGVLRTINGGGTWTTIDGGGTIAGLNIGGVAARGATLLIAVDNATTGQGIWRSTDTGVTWTRISGLAGSGLPAGASFDLAADPSNNARLFSNAGTTGIYRSNDTGATWTKVSNAAMDALMIATTSKIEIVVGASNNVYAGIINGGQLAGIFRSGDGGTTWTSLDLPTTTESGVVVGIHPGNQGGLHFSMAADRTNANIVYVGGDRQPYVTEFTTGASPFFPNSIGALNFTGRLFRIDASQPAGSQATHITHSNTASGSSPHADSRDMAIDASGHLIESDDGGVYRRTNPSTNTGDWVSLIGNMTVTEFHSVAWDSRSKVAVGGAQDNGTAGEIGVGTPRWAAMSSGDGGDVGVNDTGTAGSSVRYASAQALRSFQRRTFDSAGAFVAVVFPARTVVGGGAALVAQFVTPMRINNVTPTRLIIGGSNSVYESLDQGDTITEIGAGIPVNDFGQRPIGYGATGNADMLYVGSGDQVFIRNAAPPAALTASATYPGNGTTRQVTSIAIDPANGQRAFVVDPTNVYQTTDGGTTWTNITGNLLTLTPGTIRSLAFSTSNAAGSVIVGSDNGVFIGRGPAFTAWVAAPAGLPRAQVFDLEYDAVDQVLVAGLLGRGAWTLNLNERSPVDVALVLDLSGSMLAPACATCAPKLDVLKDAVELFAQLWTVFAVPNDRFALNYFRTDITEFLPGGSALFSVLPNASAMIADIRAQTTTLFSATAMGGGIQNAVNRLTDATRPRSVIVFTDGMQNVNPMVNATTFEIAPEPGRTNSNVLATSPVTDLNAALGRKVSTIGVGATPPFVTLLSNIATETNGLFKLTTAPDDDLRRFYVEQLIDVLRTFSPQLVGYRYATLGGTSGTQDFVSNSTARKVVLKLSWKRGAQFDLAVEKDGVDVTSLGRMISGPYYRIFAIDVPMTASGNDLISPGGQWRMRISGTAGASYEAAAIIDEDALKYTFSLGSRRFITGAPITLKLKLLLRGRPLTDARVTATVLAPREGLGTLLSRAQVPSHVAAANHEPGSSPAQHKLEALLLQDDFQKQIRPVEREVTLEHISKGSYAATLKDTKAEGAYTVILRISGKHPEIGAYERTESRSLVVQFGRVDPAGSRLGIKAEGQARHVLSVRPTDTSGNYLGPDYGNRVNLKVDGKAIESHDGLDGTYSFELPLRDLAKAQATLSVLNQTLYAGPLSGIPRSK